MGESPAEHQYMKHKASQIFKDEGDVGVYEFGSQTGEGATNMRDLGKDIGVTQRTPYPGYEEVLKKLKEAETTSTKGGIVKALRLDREHMPYIWRALQGLHYGIAPTLIGGYSLYNLLNSGTSQVDYQKFGGIMKADNARHFKHKYQIGGYIQSSNIYNSLPQTLFDMFDSVDRRLRITDRYIPREFNMGTAPTPGKPKNPGKLVTKIKGTTNAKVTPSERYIDRKTFSKKIRVQDKNARAMETEKASPVNSGQSRISNAQLKEDWETMKNYSEFKNKVNRIDVKMSKYQKGTDAYKQALKDKKSLVQEYRQKYRF